MSAASLNPPSSAARALAAFLPILGASLFWWTASDRLDLPKLVVALALALLALLITSLRGGRLRQEVWTFVLTSALAFALLFEPAGMSERVEVWGMWLLWLSMASLGRGLTEEDLSAWLTRLALALSALAWLQAAGLPLFNAELEGFEGRRVVGSLGGPGHLGWTLALLLPWAAHHLRRRCKPIASAALLAVILGALILSGARTAWIMAALGLPLGLGWPGLKPALWLLALALLGMGLAVGLDLIRDQARLSARIDDLSEAGGTAQGRAYLWRVYGSAADDWLAPGLGHGAESFQRRWPGWQNDYLRAHPQDERFRSDLRHAHADLVEIGCDLGPAAILGLLAALALALLRAPPEGIRRGGPALACLLAAGLGGLSAPVLFFAPTAALAALSLGLRLGPARRYALRGSRLVLLAMLGLSLFLLGLRTASEVNRSRASRLRAAGQLELARVLAEQALGADPGNSRAWMERAATCRQAEDASCACESVARALRFLPNDALQRRHSACQARGRWW